jgi:hypothetical protein
MNEVLNGIKVLKLYAWEIAFIRRINEIRDQELICIRQKAVLSAILRAIWTFVPTLVNQFILINKKSNCFFLKVCIVTFATYVLSSKKNILTAEKAFVSLALFNLLRFPLVLFPNVITNIVEVNLKIIYELNFDY